LSFDLLDLVLQAGLIVKLVLLVLAVFSVVSWGIIVAKWRELKNAMRDSEAFLEVYHQEPFEAAYDAARHLDRSPLAVIFLTSCNEMSRLAKEAGQSVLQTLDDAQHRSVTKIISWTAARERQRLERGLTYLATVGSAAPFIGLFGTVVGIIGTFQGIGQAGNASLAVVGPGMAEALIATAVGLLAAIPATMAYNSFASRVDAITSSIDLYASELEEDLARLGTADRSAQPRARLMGE
jgi:biopolymer transport protein TolQ